MPGPWALWESEMDEVATKIIDILKKHMKEPRDDIGLGTALTDLKIESLDLAMIVFDIEDSFGIEIPYNANEEAADFKTVGSVVERVRSLIAQSGAAPAKAYARPWQNEGCRAALRRRKRKSLHDGIWRTAPRGRYGYGCRNADRELCTGFLGWLPARRGGRGAAGYPGRGPQDPDRC